MGGGAWNVFNSHQSDPPFCKGISYYYDFLKNKMEECIAYEDSEVQVVAQGLIDFKKFQWAMSESRRAWLPQAGKGSQNNETEIYKLLANTMLKECVVSDKKRAEYDDNINWRQQHNKEELKKKAE